jgi:hypothetical protein
MFLAIKILPRHKFKIIFNTCIKKMKNAFVFIGEFLKTSIIIPIMKVKKFLKFK